MVELAAHRKKKAKESIKIDKTIATLSNEEKILIMNYVPKLRQRIRKRMLQEKNTALSRALAATRSKEEIGIVIDMFSDDIFFEPEKTPGQQEKLKPGGWTKGFKVK